SLSLVRQAEQKIRERIAGVCAIKRELAARPGGIHRGRIVVASQSSELESVRAADQRDDIIQLIFVVPENDRHKRIAIEAEISADGQARESGKRAALLHEPADSGHHCIIRTESLRGIVLAS